NPKDIPKQITIGRDGLIVERGIFKGLLLPQVPVEYGWDTKTFLAETCMKAGLPPDAWLLEGTKVYKFQALIFAEEEPRGRIIQRDLMKELKEKHKE
ncbi:MAG TPA: TIGR00296 family protein, partial [Desulfurococcales archaeon]|nr:TIGR00296 family protein [Desulfurococcales archaeon]